MGKRVFSILSATPRQSELELTSPVCDSSCSANLDGFVYALSHPSYWHLYRFSAGVADLERDFAGLLAGVGGRGVSASGGRTEVEAVGEALDGPGICTCMSSGDIIGAGLLCTAAIVVDMVMMAEDDRAQRRSICHLSSGNSTF